MVAHCRSYGYTVDKEMPMDFKALEIRLNYLEQLDVEELIELLGEEQESEEEIKEGYLKLVKKLKREGVWRED